MKSEKELARAELEVNCILSAKSMLRYLNYSPKQDSWKAYCRAFGSKLDDELTKAEYCAARS